VRRLAIGLVLAAPLALLACGGGTPAAKAPAAVATAAPPTNPQAVGKMVQGVQAAKDGARERAISLLREAITLDRGLWEAHYDLGVVLAGAGDLAGSEDELRTASKLAPDAEEVATALGELRRRRGENKEAADALGDFLQYHPKATYERIHEVTALRD
jgi:Flp pilus assembly protein TadD